MCNLDARVLEYWELTAAIARRLRYEPWVEVFKAMFRQYEDELEKEFISLGEQHY